MQTLYKSLASMLRINCERRDVAGLEDVCVGVEVDSLKRKIDAFPLLKFPVGQELGQEQEKTSESLFW